MIEYISGRAMRMVDFEESYKWSVGVMATACWGLEEIELHVHDCTVCTKTPL